MKDVNRILNHLTRVEPTENREREGSPTAGIESEEVFPTGQNGIALLANAAGFAR